MFIVHCLKKRHCFGLL